MNDRDLRPTAPQDEPVKAAPESRIVTVANAYAANQQRIAFLRQEQGRIQQAIEDNVIEAHELRARLIALVDERAA